MEKQQAPRAPWVHVPAFARLLRTGRFVCHASAASSSSGGSAARRRRADPLMGDTEGPGAEDSTATSCEGRPRDRPARACEATEAIEGRLTVEGAVEEADAVGGAKEEEAAEEVRGAAARPWAMFLSTSKRIMERLGTRRASTCPQRMPQ